MKQIRDCEESLCEVVEEICECTTWKDLKIKEAHYIAKYPQLYNSFPTIISKACEPNFDFQKFKWMMEMQKKVRNNSISQHNASVEVGERLVDEHVKPHLS